MAALEGLLSPACNSDKKAREAFKFAKSAIKNGRFDATAGPALERVIHAVVVPELTKIDEANAKAAAAN